MIGKNKAQITASALNYALAAFVSVIVLIGGYKTVSLVREKACNTEMAKFEIDLKKLDESVRFGAKELQSHQAPCNAEQIYFLGSNKKAKPEYLKEVPIIEDALKSQSGNNIFLVKGNEVKRSFYAGNLEMLYPYYICFAPKFDKISFFVEGAGEYAKIAGACGQPECTLIPMNISENEAKGVIQEAIDFGCVKCPTYLNGELENMRLTKEKVEMFRKFSVCGGITTVEITIKPKKGSDLKDIRVYEFIPKECVDDLNKYLVGQIEGDVYIKSDPLIMWHFDELKKEEKVSYKLSKELGEDCMQAILGLGVSQIKQFCRNKDDDCGISPNCQECIDTYSANYCSANNVVWDFNDYKCSDNQCVPSPTQQIVQTCNPPQTCVGGGCVCTPQTCASLGKQCGSWNDGCGGTLNCGGCSFPDSCNANGQCVPQTCGGIQIGQCDTNNKPKYCNSALSLVDNCNQCGCPVAGDICQSSGVCTAAPIVSPALSVSCHASPSNQQVGKPVEWVASPLGGKKLYTYLWTGDVSGTDKNVQAAYSSAGTKTANVQVTSGAETKSAGCSATIGTAPPVCGNNLIESGEECDGADLGEQTCSSQNKGTGTLMCTSNCQYDYSGCVTSQQQNCATGTYALNCKKKIGTVQVYCCDKTQDCKDKGYYDTTHVEGECPLVQWHKVDCDCYVDQSVSCSSNPCCPAGYTIRTQTQCCVPNCAGRQCGDNGCGGSCGTCSSGTCSNGQCVISCTNLCSSGDKRCYGGGYQYCENVGGCWVWSLTFPCSSGWSCEQATGNCKPLSASLSASYSNLQKNAGSPPPGSLPGDNWWYYKSTLAETSGNIGITIQQRQKCYNALGVGNFCVPIKSDIATSYGTNYITAGGQISDSTNNVYYSSGLTVTVTETFWGVDDNGNNKQASYSFTVTS